MLLVFPFVGAPLLEVELWLSLTGSFFNLSVLLQSFGKAEDDCFSSPCVLWSDSDSDNVDAAASFLPLLDGTLATTLDELAQVNDAAAAAAVEVVAVLVVLRLLLVLKEGLFVGEL